MAFKIVFTGDYVRADQTVEAEYFTDESPFTTFKTSNGKAVLSLRTEVIQEIARVPESTVVNMTEEQYKAHIAEYIEAPSRYTVFSDPYTLSGPLHLVVDREEKTVIAKYATSTRSNAEAHSNRLNLENK